MGEFSGYDVAAAVGAALPPEVERKTDTSTSNKESTASTQTQKYFKSNESNILNKYRSITYNFTLAGLPSDYVSRPEAYREGELGLVILKSGGKGFTGITSPTKSSAAQRKQVETEVYDKFDSKTKTEVDTKNISQLESDNQLLVKEFNSKSPGRFDMFIENVEIETLMSFSEQSNTTLPTKVKFDVIEPYSVNGFIEALHVAAVAAGYTSYVNASFLLKIEFWGIPDSDTQEFKQPEKIKADRYFPIGLTNVEVELTEKGTKYSCSAVPYNERTFGQPSLIKKPIKMEGKSVNDILTNFMKSFNEQIKQSDEDGKTESSNSDEYIIKFVDWDAAIGWKDSPESKIAKSPLLNLFEDNVLYGFAQPNQGNNAYKPGTEPKSIAYNPEKAVVNFPEGKSVHDVISAVIRDSEYIRTLLRDLANKDVARSKIDSFGLVEYFMIKVETANLDVYDTVTKKPYQKFTYVVSPYKVHFTRIPMYGSVQLKEEEYAKLSLREYNYFYMGKNIDVLTFRLNFNTLYFEAVPVSMADQNTPNYRDSAKPDSRNKAQLSAPSKEEQVCNNPAHPMPPVREVSTPVQPADGSAVPIQNDPYSTMARSMHDAIVNSKASMVTGEIDILGDPYYLVTGGMGSYNPTPEQDKKGSVGQGESNPLGGEVNITINFRNPIDIDSFENGGVMKFDPKRVPFSGIYMVTKVSHTFKDGLFKQKLDIIRKPGQILDDNCGTVGIDELTKSVVNSDNKAVVTPAENQAPSARLDSTGVDTLLSRGAPNLSSNFTNAVGGLGGPSLATAFGAVSKGSLQAGSSVIGQMLPSDVASNIRLKTSSLANLMQDKLSSAALVNAAANVITGNASAKQVLGSLAGSVLGAVINSSVKSSNVGSGIGEGAKVSIPGVSSLPTDPTALDVKAGVTAIGASVAGVTALSKDLGANALSSISRLGTNASQLVGDIKSKIDSSLGSIADPKAIAAKVGLNSSKLSGLSNNLQSKMSDQISDLKNKIPANVDLAQMYSKGLALDVLPSSKFGNIPPSTPFMTAPLPDADVGVAAASQLISTTNLNLNKVDGTAIKDKLNTAKTQLSKLTGNVNIPDSSSLGSVAVSFGSKAAASPLNSLIKKVSKLPSDNQT